ncbi:MAG TPA: D-alanyl-D-alanine carboxypeptidase/D-alanyl-D-alanine-endopeptidase, partial [Gemmatimonadales bacterium]|nr:D-alanyl-D-alanine carboxypeptidase/D-alanyl-D-alanine-endopeptidase [Gemmatimonadales bacterium]
VRRFSSRIRPACTLGLAVILSGFSVPAQAQTDQAWLSAEMSEWYGLASRRAPGQWGIAIGDPSGRILWSVNAEQELIPASTVKLFTTGFARSVLGGTARRPTRVVGEGELDIATGEWVGSWALELNGDPTLERAQGSGPTLYDLALQLASSGVRRLTGPLKVQSADGPANAVYPAAWSSRHRGRLFAPLVGPLTVHENVIWITVRPGAKAGHRARLIETAPSGISSMVTVTARTTNSRRSRLSLQRRRDGGWIVAGTIGRRAAPRRLTTVVSDPRRVLEAVWASALTRAGIEWKRSAYIGAKPAVGPRILAEVASPPLDSLASEINRRSLNLGAELLLQWAGGRDGAHERLTEHVRQVIGTDGRVRLVDGSGLSYDDRVTPSAFISYLARFPGTAAGHNFPQLLPANGTGTLRRLNSGFPGEGVVRAKTGTLGQVSTVVGYLGRPEGVLIVSLMYNGSRPWAARQAQWNLFRELGANGVIIPADTVAVPPVQLGGEQTAAPAWWPGSLGSADSAAADSLED